MRKGAVSQEETEETEKVEDAHSAPRTALGEGFSIESSRLSSLSKDVASAPGTWVETPLETPLQLSAGTRYRLGAYSGGGMHHLSIAAPALFAHGTIDQSYATAGDTFPNRSDGAHWWLVDLRYVPGSTEIESRGPCRKGLLGQESAEVQTGCSQGQTQIKIKD